jgi:hypothetical protein
MNVWKLSIVLLAACTLSAQEYRATILGTLTDPTGASVPGARVTITNIETHVSSSTETGTDGNYVIPFLVPGSYSLRLEKEGFKTTDRSPIELHVNDRSRIDVKLEIGQSTDRVTVTGEAPLLETASSSRGQVVDARAIADMPLNSRNPFTLMNLATGVNYTNSLLYFRPFDNGAIGYFSINGGQNGLNTFQIDGAPNDASNAGSELAYVPPVEATQEFKVQTNLYDAQYGRTSGGVVNVSVKPGTNILHGAVYEYLRRTSLNANPFAQNAAGAPRAQHPVDQYGWELDGPVRIPKLYNGRDRTFFMFSQERYREFTPQPPIETVPTALQRAGDFSQTFKSATQLYTIYDPSTVALNPAYNPAQPITANNSQYLRQAFPNNQVPQNRINPVALNVLKDIPLPNQSGLPFTQLQNYYGANVGEATDFQNLIARVDHYLSDKVRVYGRWNHNFRDGGRIDYNGWGTPATSVIHAGRKNDGAVFDVVDTLSPRTILDLRISYGRFKALSVYNPIDIKALGFPGSLLSQLPISDKYPIFNFTNYTATGVNEWDVNPNETYTASAGLTHIAGKHSLKFGAEYRLIHNADTPRTNGMGNYSFDVDWTRRTPDFADPNSGNGIATFLLGNISSGSVSINAATYVRWRYPVLYFQDDWQVTRRLTLNLGIRWEEQSPGVERFNQQVGYVDLNAPFPIMVPGMPNLKGGLTYAGVGGVTRGAFNPDWWNFQPRVGFAYKMLRSKPLVFRGGVGRTFIPYQTTNPATNFSRNTNVLTSTSDYHPIGNLSNPFPDGLLQPLGSSLGLATNAGTSISSNSPNTKIPYVWQFSGGFEYEIRPGLLAEASYSGSRTYQLGVGQALDFITLDQMARGSAYLNQLVPNPFYGLLPSSTSLGTQKTIAQSALITQYPQFTGVTVNSNPIGLNWYNSAQFKLEERFKHGLSFLMSYTISKNLQASSYLNNQDTSLARALVSFDKPQRLVLSGIYELPIGPKKAILNQGVASKIVGGWQVNMVFSKQSGVPIAFNSGYYLLCDPKLDTSSVDRWFNTDTSCWQQRPSNTLRTMPLYSGNIRTQTAPQMDASIFRDIYIKEHHKVQFKFSVFNALNTPLFPAPNTSPSSSLFGRVTLNQINLPRNAEIGLRYAF